MPDPRSRPTFSRRSALALTAAAVLAPAVTRAQAPTHLALAGVPEDSITPVLYGVHSGLFGHYGLDVAVQPQRSGPAIASGVAGGSYQIGKASLSPLIIAHGKGIPFVLVAPGGIYEARAPISGLIVKTDSTLSTAHDFVGKTVAVLGLNDINTVSMRAWADANGGDSSTLKLVEIPTSEMGAAVERGSVDGALINEPSFAQALASGKVKVVARPYSAVAPRFMYTAWFANASEVAGHRAVFENFAKAMHEAGEYVNAHHDQTVPLLAAFTSVSPAVIARMTRVEAGVTLDPKLIQPVIDATAKYKQIDAVFDARDLIAPGLT